jgi:biopolymer transport protein ExbD
VVLFGIARLDQVVKVKRKQSKSDIPTMAMGDIAFNLLIFFVILARAQDDSHLKWKPAEAVDLEAAKYAKVSVIMDHEQKLYLNGQQVGESELASLIEKNLGNTPAGERYVLLKCDRDVTALRFQPVLEAVGEAGGDLVHVLNKKR